MTDPSPHADNIAQALAGRIGADNAHGYARDKNNHVPKLNDPRLGPAQDINSAEDYRAMIERTLNDPGTEGFRANEKGKYYFYNRENNILVIIDPANNDGGTAYRPGKPSYAERYWQDKVIGQAEERFGIAPDIRPGGLPAHIGDNTPAAQAQRQRLAEIAGISGGTPAQHMHTGIGAAEPQGIDFGRLANRFGMVAGAITAGYLAIQGEYAQAAETITPGATPVMAAMEGRPAEAAMAAIEEVPLGFMITEVARPMAQDMGFDVDPGMAQAAIFTSSGDTRSPDQQTFDSIYEALPATLPDGSPPEVEALAEIKRLIVSAENNIRRQEQSGTVANYTPLDRAQAHYEKLYGDLQGNGSLDKVNDYLSTLPSSETPAKPDATTEEAAITVNRPLPTMGL